MSCFGLLGVVYVSVYQGFDDMVCGVEFDGFVEEVVGFCCCVCFFECWC